MKWRLEPNNEQAVEEPDTPVAKPPPDEPITVERPRRVRAAPDRFAIAAIAARHAEFAGVGFDAESPRMPEKALFVDLSDGAERIAELALLSCAAIDTPEFDEAEYVAAIAAEFEELPPEAQRAMCIAADHDDLSLEFGAASPQATLARKLYAAAVLDAACVGISVPLLEPLVKSKADPSLVACPDDIFDAKYDGHLFAVSPSPAPPSISHDLSLAAKAKSSPDIFTERQMMGPEWDESKSTEIAKLERMNAMRWVPADDPSLRGRPVVPCMWTGRCKRYPDGSIEKLNSRCVERGDLHAKFYNISSNEAHSPVVATQSMHAIDAVGCLRGQTCTQADVTGAYLQGDQRPNEATVTRPPVGFRRWDERGVELLWDMDISLYGKTDAGAIWNRTYNEFVTTPEPDGLGYARCSQEPCLYGKYVPPDGRINMPLYVDDYKQYADRSPKVKAVAEKDMARLSKRFEQRAGESDAKESFFLGANRTSNDKGDLVSLRATSYVDLMVKRYFDGDVSEYPASWSYTPADESLTKAYEAAVATRPVPTPELKKRYGSLFGSLLHAVKIRGEIAAPLGRLGTCLTICTEELYTHLKRVLVYLARTRSLGVTYSAHVDGADKLVAYADSDWSTTRSTTGYVVTLAGASICHASRRQHCITMSSCEAELIALAECAIELIYLDYVTEFAGLARKGPIEVCTDSQSAYNLCHRFTSAQGSRHIDRKVFKMRELRGSGVVTVRHIPGDQNPADLFTKVLSRQPFEKHRKVVMNLPGDTGAEHARRELSHAKTSATTRGDGGATSRTTASKPSAAAP